MNGFTAAGRPALILAPVVLAASLNGCGSSCRGFDYSFTRTAVGEASPAQAVAAWVKDGDEKPPRHGWSESGVGRTESGPSGSGQTGSGQSAGLGDRTFVNGDWRVSVTAMPDGGWLVSGGSSC